ncbi:MAG: methyltransferase family protein [Bacteroidota bacterium]|jgi:protein-S-isoprenylcysteine O-methyltransferase Ste14|nr:isoprenylcysteine carboxylmethyltransferase family protein [Ignavibacteria bacterium]MCU7499200.1 isoprenylcysteine carboxylmethyltransferase family protein [Ignavibacteria bacterium]MCU7520123.1 isoprenylcysteine carboxylmethyltransferase family protein [Ignavibacteria bacterium]MCU7524582.1 isoprenylcysteine carboxylmethyltransferase family protein [Ignavibacteria bacterium]
MDPINILLGLNLIATLGANMGGAKKGFRSAITVVKERPKTFLQNLPPNVSLIVLVFTIVSIFQIGTLSYGKYPTLNSLRLFGLFFNVAFSWFQVWAYKSMGESYSQDILITKNHELVTKGPFKVVRHPQYLGQILTDLGAALALLSYIVLPLVLFLEVPLLILRAREEDRLLAKHFKEKYDDYRKKTGFLLPFIG